MATTLLKGRERLVIDGGVVGHKDFPDALLTEYLNVAQRDIQKKLNGLGLKKFETGYDATSNLAAVKYNGANVKKITMAQIKTGSTYDVGIYPNSIRLIECGDGVSLAASTTFGIAKITDEQFFHDVIANSILTPTLKDPRFMWQDNEIILSPSTITACKVHFYRVVKDLSSDTDEFEVPDEFIDHVIKRANIDIQHRLKLLTNKDEAIKALDKEIKEQFDSYQASLAIDNMTQPQQVQLS